MEGENLSVLDLTASSSQNSLTGDLTASSSQNSLTGGVVAGSSQNPMPGGGSCGDNELGGSGGDTDSEPDRPAVVVVPGSDLDGAGSNEVAGFSGNCSALTTYCTVSKSLRGGYTCCVPGCYNNTKKNKEFSFHKFPKDKVLKEKWINAIKRKEFVSSDSHRVCSKHFNGGRKCSISDIPVIFPLLPRSKTRKRPKPRDGIPPLKRKKTEVALPTEGTSTNNEDVEVLTAINTNENVDLSLEIEKLKNEKKSLLLEIETLKFGLKRFAGSDDDIRFYTAFLNYSTLLSFYEFLLPAASKLNYWGSENSENRTEMKHGPQRKIQPIDELFMVLYRLRCDILEKDIADRFQVSSSTVSRTLVTWINFL